MTIAKHCRIFELNPTDDFIIKREAAIKDISALYFKKNTIDDLMTRAIQACAVFSDSSSYPQQHRGEVEAIIQKKSASFVGEDGILELGVCSALAGLHSLNATNKPNSFGTIEIFAIYIWSILSFIPNCDEPKLNELQETFKSAARKKVLESSEISRTRQAVPNFGSIDTGPITQEIFESATKKTVETLRSNAAFDREEIDILWWVIAEFSEIFDCPFSNLSQQSMAIAKGIELGKYMRTYPAQSHRNLLLRGTVNNSSYTLSELISALGEDREKFSSVYEDKKVIFENPEVFPLLYSLLTQTVDKLGGEVSRPLAEWSSRALLESAIINIRHAGNRDL